MKISDEAGESWIYSLKVVFTWNTFDKECNQCLLVLERFYLHISLDWRGLDLEGGKWGTGEDRHGFNHWDL